MTKRRFFEVGVGNDRFSIQPNEDEEVIGIDPNSSGRSRGRFTSVSERVQDVQDKYRGTGNGALITSPDPDQAEDIASATVELLKPGARLAVVFDRRSNKKTHVPNAVLTLQERFGNRARVYSDLEGWQVGNHIGAEIEELDSEIPVEEENTTVIIRRSRH